MDLERAKEIVNRKFRYQADGKLDQWSILDINSSEIKGDCEDYALTVVWLMSDRKIWKFLYNLLLNPKLSIWIVTTKRGNGHAILEYDTFFVDNIQRKWFIKTDPAYKEYKWRFKMFPPLILGKFLVSAPFLLWSFINKNYRK